MNRSESLLLGLALGAGVAYLLDPDRGTRRRALLRDKLVHAGHELEDAARANVRHARNRVGGLAHEAVAGLTERQVEDRVLEERVRSQVGRGLSSAGGLDILADQGRITLSGVVPAEDMQDVVRTVQSVRGVRTVENRLAGQTRTQEHARERSR
jgi:osmotically-inducible protein OsmY